MDLAIISLSADAPTVATEGEAIVVAVPLTDAMGDAGADTEGDAHSVASSEQPDSLLEWVGTECQVVIDLYKKHLAGAMVGLPPERPEEPADIAPKTLYPVMSEFLNALSAVDANPETTVERRLMEACEVASRQIQTKFPEIENIDTPLIHVLHLMGDRVSNELPMREERTYSDSSREIEEGPEKLAFLLEKRGLESQKLVDLYKKYLANKMGELLAAPPAGGMDEPISVHYRGLSEFLAKLGATTNFSIYDGHAHTVEERLQAAQPPIASEHREAFQGLINEINEQVMIEAEDRGLLEGFVSAASSASVERAASALTFAAVASASAVPGASAAGRGRAHSI